MLKVKFSRFTTCRLFVEMVMTSTMAKRQVVLDSKSFLVRNRQLVLPRPFSNGLKFATFVMRTEISPLSVGCSRIIDYQVWCCIRMTHERDSKSLDTMIDVHPVSNLSCLKIRRHRNSFRMALIVISPCVLSDQILSTVSNAKDFWGMSISAYQTM